MYYQNNREKLIEYERKWRLNKKNVQSDNNEGTSFVNPQTGDFTNLVKLSIVCEENFEEGNLLSKGDGESNNAKNEKNQIEVEEPNKIIEDDRNSVDSNEKMQPFDLNERPDDECEDKGEEDQIDEEDPNNIRKDDTIDLNKKIHPFDLNEKPGDEE
uniref:Uncharacterized protein n=1 Tax=Meloidogyne incognita TaxID=6306 RepID=A0A914LDV1_MELIC